MLLYFSTRLDLVVICKHEVNITVDPRLPVIATYAGIIDKTHKHYSLAWPDPTRKEGSGPMPNMDLYHAVST